MLNSWKSDLYSTALWECPKDTLAFWIAGTPKIKQKDWGNEGRHSVISWKRQEAVPEKSGVPCFSPKHKISK